MNTSLQLKLLLPTQVLLEREVKKIVAEAENGSFCLLPRHIDFVTALVPGILELSDTKNQNHLYAIDQGILVKCGHTVRISTVNAICGTDLHSLQEAIETRFLALDESERQARSALARLEAGAIRRFMRFEKLRHYG